MNEADTCRKYVLPKLVEAGWDTAPLLRFLFLMPAVLGMLAEASPGGAGRNRTLGLKKLETIMVHVLLIEAQHEFDRLQAKVDQLDKFKLEAQHKLDALLPSILDRAFKGEF
jgi:type I restriction enzyme S subunit